jgi:hypothetical protein
MIVKHVLCSVNDCEIHIPDTITLGTVNLNRVRWEDFPPSREDLYEINHGLLPDKVIPPVEAMLRRTEGHGHMVEMIPGFGNGA